MNTASTPRIAVETRDERLRSLDRDAALAAGLSTVEADLVEECYRTGAGVADARRWYAWSRRLGAVHFLLLGALGLPLAALVILALVDLPAAQALASALWSISIGIAVAWLANLVAHLLTPDVLRIAERATRSWDDPHWSRAVRAVAEVDAERGSEAAATFDGALALLHPDATRLAEGDALWLRLNGPTTTDPALAGLRTRVEQQVLAITTPAIRLISGGPAELEVHPVEWHAAPETPARAVPERRLANGDDLR